MHNVHIDHRASLIKEKMARIRRKILIMSNKGGVGKSTIAVNFAALLAARGLKTGLLDIDIHGPSVARMTGQEGKPHGTDGKSIDPLEAAPNLKMISMGSIMKEGYAPVIWRGPLKLTVLKQFLADVNWGDLDTLVIDAPPGTGDEPLTICQLIPEMTGAVVVTTGQAVALLDSRKAVNFLKQVGIPVLGILENMTVFNCPHCAGKISLFKTGGGAQAAAEMGVPFLGSVPFDPAVVDAGDSGKIYALENPAAGPSSAIAAALDAALGRSA
ncbi:MAG: ATP-binding protein [Elusimicrobia bacterium CG_4_10_14_0_2_um_filter_56_8]|nr:MAG: ATP-binding protein [Elusimicrobia bacterium CG1_02_56_21]PJA14288.1 MAG: ATP-binding protein [Elusimicrobia bacterium CG_4_10_14_0_2_um_filter_56_8]